MRKDGEGLARTPTRGPRLPVLAAVAALLAVAGCGGESGGGNNLVVGYDQEPAILNEFIIGGDLQASADVNAGVLQAPITPTPDLDYAPELAGGDPEVVSEDPFTIEYTLQEGLTWSDGEPLTSDDARFTYEQITDPDNQTDPFGWEDIESFETPDDRTVRMVFGEPYAPWRTLLEVPILPRHVYEGQDFNTALNDEVVGSGPFVLREWNKGESLVLERNENYWGERPALDMITFRFIPDTNSLTAALAAGEVDFINPKPDVGLIEELESMDGITLDSEYGAEWEHIGFNTEEIDSLALRQAIAYGIDRERIVNQVLPGQARVLDSVLAPEQEQYYVPAWEDYAYDPDRARELVEEAEQEGAETTITFSTTSGNGLREALQEVVRQQLEEVGITVEIENAPAEELLGGRMPAGDFQLGEWGWSASPDPDLAPLFSRDALPPDGQNWYRYEDEEVSELLEQSEVTIDEGERAGLVRRAQELMAEDVPLIPLYQAPNIYAYTGRLEGPVNNPTLAGAFWNVGEWSLE